jgi:hypothetical protein
MPGYAPELNPDEILNQDLKRGVFKSKRPKKSGELVERNSNVSACDPNTTEASTIVFPRGECRVRGIGFESLGMCTYLLSE